MALPERYGFDGGHRQSGAEAACGAANVKSAAPVLKCVRCCPEP